jgi:GNAT superfamily N-acetyltransferase
VSQGSRRTPRAGTSGSAAGDLSCLSDLKVETWAAQRFYRALEGSTDGAATHQLAPLPFYHRTSLLALPGQPETRTFVLAHGTLAHSTRRHIVGLVELETNPDNAMELWLYYIAVAEPLRGHGISKQLLPAVVQLVRTRGQRLSVSYPTRDSQRGGFQAFLAKSLDLAGLSWAQSRGA